MASEAPLITCPNCGKKNRAPAAAAGVPHCGNCGTSLPWLTESGETDFSAVVEQSSLPVLVDFLGTLVRTLPHGVAGPREDRQ